jgi:hypothetical protein
MAGRAALPSLKVGLVSLNEGLDTIFQSIAGQDGRK